MTISAILLAAGASTRMQTVKALLPLDGRPAVLHLAEELLQVASECIVVTGYHSQQVTNALAGRPGIRVAHNPHPDRGQLSSLQTGIQALDPAHADWFLFTPVDCMGIGKQVLQPLVAAMETASPETLLCIPCHGERRGHPVAARFQLAAEFLALSADATARSITRQYRPRTQFVPQEDGRFLLDVDLPEDYAQLLERRSAKPFVSVPGDVSIPGGAGA